MTKIESVTYVPAGESIDGGLGEGLWENRDAIERFVSVWATETSKLLGGVPVTISSRCDFANASKLTVETDTGDDYDVREEVGDTLDRAFETASIQIAAEFSAA